MRSILLKACFLISISHLASVTPMQASVDWMKGQPDDKTLAELTILGTHNTCALFGGLYGKCQDASLGKQLEWGVRFLDIRCQWKDDDLHIVHGITDQKMKFSEVVDTCQDFLKENPSETIMMSIMEQSSKARKKGEFGQTFQKIIKKSGNNWYQKKGIPKLGDVRGKVVIVSRNREVRGIPWGSFQVQDAFRISKNNTIDGKWQKITEHFENIEKMKKPNINFISCTGILSPPESAADRLNPKLIAYMKKERKKAGIIVVDFVSEELAETVMDHE